MDRDVLIFGGGATGLWLLDALLRRGAAALLVDAHGLGAGQTIAAQGIIHGGLKYTLRGALTAAAVRVREMPRLWRDCLAGRCVPDLSGVRLRAASCHLWRTDSLSSRLGMMGARAGLRVAPQTVEPAGRPPVLHRCPGTVARLDEPVIAPDSLLEVLARPHWRHIVRIDPAEIDFDREGRGGVRAVRLAAAAAGKSAIVRPRHVVLAAGQGNAELRRRLGLADTAMQRRPLHMALLRGDLPAINGHCVDGAATRVTITSDRDSQGRTVWQVGGQIAEAGVALDERMLAARTMAEIEATVPGIDLRAVEWATYRVDRAEGATPGGARPDTFQLLSEQNVLTAWPTKLALVPLLIEAILARLGAAFPAGRCDDGNAFADWPRPSVALPPWETPRTWWTSRQLQEPHCSAA